MLITTRMSQQALDSTTWVTLSESHSEYDQAGRVTLSRQLANPGTVNNTDDNIVQTTYNYDSSVDQRWTKAPGVTTIGTSPAAADLLTEYLYDVQGRQTAIIDAAGQTTSYEYDLAGRVTKVTQPGSLETLTEYDDAGRVYTVTNSAGDIQEREYNSRGQVVKQFMLDVDGAVTTAVRQQRWQYDGLGKITREAIMADPTSISDPCETIDRVTDYDRDYSIVNRYEKTYTYSGANIATTVSVLATASGYNGSGTGKINTSVRYSYNGQPAEADYHIYNASDRPVTRYNKYWDESGTLVKTLTTQMLYDHHGQMTASYLVGTSSNLTTSYEYDGAGRKISETSPGGMETEYAYDGFGRLTAKIEDAGGIARTTGYEYNRLGQLEYQIAYNDSDTQTTTYAYDKLGRETSVTYPDSGVVTYAYNSQGKVNQRVDQNTITTVYEYDELGRLTSKQDAVGSPSIIETYAYDSRGLMTAANKVEGTYPNYTNVASDSFSYNGLGYLTQAQQTIGTASTYTVEYSRDQLGQAASIVYPYTGTPGRTLNYAYTSLGKIDHIQDSASNTLVNYDYSGSLVAQRTYDQITTTATRTYDDFGRLSSYVTANAVSQVVNFGYTYDADSNIVSQQFNHRGAGLENGYSYDSLDRVTGSDYHSSSTFTDETFVYDTLGNRITHSQSGDTVYVPNIANEYTSIGGTAVSYDNAGNLTADHRSGDPSGTAYNYHYDYENRLTAIDTTFTIGENQITIAIAKFAYDALGRWVEKTEEYMSGTTHHYYYDGWRVLRHERDTHNIEYVYGNYLDEVCMQIYAGATDNPFYLVHDHLYSPVAILNQNGDTHESREYSAYGYTGNNTTFCEIAFTGQRQDTFADRDLKLMYYKNRYYDTGTGRFLTRDPMGIRDELCLVDFSETGQPILLRDFSIKQQYQDGMSLYMYVSGDPIKYFDPMGLAIGFDEWIEKQIWKWIWNKTKKWYWENKGLDPFGEVHNFGPEQCQSPQVRRLDLEIEKRWLLELKVKTFLGPPDTMPWATKTKGPYLTEKLIWRFWTCTCPTKPGYTWSLIDEYEYSTKDKADWKENLRINMGFQGVIGYEKNYVISWKRDWDWEKKKKKWYWPF